MVDGHVVRAGPTRAVTVGRDASPAHADAVAEALRAGASALGRHARLVKRRAGEAHDVWGSDPTWPS